MLRHSITLFLGLLITSCINEVDFDQSTEVVIEPVTEISLVFLDVEASRFLDNGVEIQSVSDSISNIEIFTNEVVVDYLIRAELFFEVTNQIDRQFQVTTQFLDENNQTLRVTQFFINEQTATANQTQLFTIEFDENNIDALVSTKTIRFNLELLPSADGSIIDESDTDLISLKSKGVFFFRAATTE